MDKLKREIAAKRYDVDAGAVANAIVSKMVLVKQGRRALDVDAGGRMPAPFEPSPRQPR